MPIGLFFPSGERLSSVQPVARWKDSVKIPLDLNAFSNMKTITKIFLF